jgi:antitoxin (DNA-binding transcriptional repressor) of toxin-antitoxin stability system
MTMQTTLAVEDIKLTLPDGLAPGDEVILTRNHQPVAKLVSEASKTRQPRKAGNLRVENQDAIGIGGGRRPGGSETQGAIGIGGSLPFHQQKT